MAATGVTISSRGYFVLPAKLRKEMKLKSGGCHHLFRLFRYKLMRRRRDFASCQRSGYRMEREFFSESWSENLATLVLTLLGT